MNIAERIKKIANTYGMGVGDIAKAMGVKQPQLSRTINNERINLKDLESIASVIGCSVSDFFCETVICPHCGKPIKIKIE